MAARCATEAPEFEQSDAQARESDRVYGRRVNSDDLIGRLPEAYAVALRLHRRGRDDVIADQLGIAPQSVAALLRVAEAKLERLRSSTDAPKPAGRMSRGDEDE
jgi:hypothetical protein